MPIINGIDVSPSAGMPTWDQGGETYHLNLSTETFHVTKEGKPKIQYFFEVDGLEIKSKRPTGSESGRNSEMFNKLPQAVQDFVTNNWNDLLQVK